MIQYYTSILYHVVSEASLPRGSVLVNAPASDPLLLLLLVVEVVVLVFSITIIIIIIFVIISW